MQGHSDVLNWHHESDLAQLHPYLAAPLLIWTQYILMIETSIIASKGNLVAMLHLQAGHNFRYLYEALQSHTHFYSRVLLEVTIL